MFKGLYRKLAFTNMKNNKRFYLPYMITAIVTVAMFYIMCSIAWNKSFLEVPGGASLKSMLNLGCYIVGITAIIFLFYTNSFLMKRRKRELGIYNILGMEKKHISRVLLLETLFMMAASIGAGLLIGILFDKLMIMLLFKIMGSPTVFVFEINIKALLVSLLLFVVIFSCTLIYNLLQVKLANPIHLLHGTNVGEKEPKTKILLTLIGIACVGYAYYVSITTTNPLAALNLFFVAVILVIIGTYCLFVSGSIALLKLLRKNKKFYYKTNHFTAVSGMLYRMKQNAVGLSNICILSTMVLVILSTTFCMYVGIDDELVSRFPYDISVIARYDDVTNNREQLESTLQKSVTEQGRKIQKLQSALTYNVFAEYEDGEWKTENVNPYSGTATQLMFLTASDYLRQEVAEPASTEVADAVQELTEDEVVIYGSDCELPQQILFQGLNLKVKQQTAMNGDTLGWHSDYFAYVFYVVVKDDNALMNIYQSQAAMDAQDVHHTQLMYELDLDVDGDAKGKVALANSIEVQLDSLRGNASDIYLESRELNREEFMGMYGTFFFLGIFMGSLFLMITVLIIFYKQISEGFEDKERFAIMQNVGMSKREVRRSIRSQIQLVFFLPLVTAAVHVFAAFPMIKRLLVVLNLSNDTLFAYCLLGTILVFGVIYFLVFSITSRTYYKILGER